MSSSASLLTSANDTGSGSAPTAVGAATLWQAIQGPDDDTSYIQFGAAGAYSFTYSDLPAALGVDSVLISVSYKFVGVSSDQQTRMYVILGGVSYYSTLTNSQNASYTNITHTWTVNPATSTAWTPAAVNAAKFGVEYSTAGAESIAYSGLSVTVSYTPTPAAVEVSRHLASYELWLRKRPEAFLAAAGNFDLLNLSILELVDMEHTAGPHETDIGWEDEVWQRRPFAVHGIDIDPIGMGTTLRLKDQRAARCLVRDLAWSDKASGTLRDGISRFSTPGSVFTFTRASEHTFTNPVGESETVPADCEAYGDGGLYMLSAAGSIAAPRYYVTNNTGERTLNAAQGTFFCEVNLAAVSAVANQTVAYCYHDASNWWWLYWDPVTATDRWVFEIRAGGSTYRAIKETTPSSATWYRIGARWTGSNTENGVSAYTLSIFIDGVKGTDAVAGAAMTEVASSNFDFGSKAAAGTDQLNGQIRKIHSLQYVMTDTEMQRAI